MNLANRLSLARLLLAPCVVASLLYYDAQHEQFRYLALACFLAGMLLDAADGFIARFQHQQSQLGTVLDPIADKLLIISALISLSTIRALPDAMRVPGWFNLIVISRDVVVIVGTMLLFAFTGKFTVKTSWLGKCTIAAQMAVVPVALLGWPIKPLVLGVAAVLTVLSGLGYLRLGMRVLDA
ncbi:MAG: CDP-alcohol phosphatidyltransferase family protein [Candidatus Omnitrophica bacterium]|nr:CDP-alcohol phosphatidyltransferase family protein [Candidatus Omnitrophota bacterium]